MYCNKHSKLVKKTLLFTGYVCDVCDGIVDVDGNKITQQKDERDIDTLPPPPMIPSSLPGFALPNWGIPSPGWATNPQNNSATKSNINGRPLLTFPNLTTKEIDDLYTQLRTFYDTINQHGGPNSSIAQMLFMLTDKEAEIILTWGSRPDIWADWISGYRKDPKCHLTGPDAYKIIQMFVDEYEFRYCEDVKNGHINLGLKSVNVTP